MYESFIHPKIIFEKKKRFQIIELYCMCVFDTIITALLTNQNMVLGGSQILSELLPYFCVGGKNILINYKVKEKFLFNFLW
jgi:hypothetical protein